MQHFFKEKKKKRLSTVSPSNPKSNANPKQAIRRTITHTYAHFKRQTDRPAYIRPL